VIATKCPKGADLWAIALPRSLSELLVGSWQLSHKVGSLMAPVLRMLGASGYSAHP